MIDLNYNLGSQYKKKSSGKAKNLILENGEKNWFWRNVYSQPSVLEISNVAAPDSKSHVASMVLLVLDSTTKPCV